MAALIHEPDAALVGASTRENPSVIVVAEDSVLGQSLASACQLQGMRTTGARARDAGSGAGGRKANLVVTVFRVEDGHLTGSDISSTQLRARLNSLSPREGEVLRAMMDGWTVDEIAKLAGLSIATVRSHVQRILAKLGVHCQLAAVAAAHRGGWIGPDLTIGRRRSVQR